MVEKNIFNQHVGDLVANWSSVDRPSKKTMHGRYCILELLDIEKYAAGLFETLNIKNKGESWTYLPYGPFNSLNDFKEWLKQTINDSDTLLYVILDATSKRILGVCGYLRINPIHGSIEVGHLHFSALLKRTPAATEVIYLLMHHAFEELHYRRYEWKCHSLNEASRNAALRYGFQFEGVFRNCNVFKGRNRDTAWFSIIDVEWPMLRDKFKRWLHPDNFDSHGNQQVKLRDI